MKVLEHSLGDSMGITNGSEVAKGYKPDATIYDKSNNKPAVIIEFEKKTDRKAFLGDFVKAEKYAEDSDARPFLVIILTVYDNTTKEQIANHLVSYREWLRNLGAHNLQYILVISETDYLKAIQANELLDSPSFRARAVTIP